MTVGRGSLIQVWIVIAFASWRSELTAATVVVNDGGDGLHSPGCATTGAGACTLRDAMTFANANLGADTILFDLPGAGVHTIGPASALPSLTDNAGTLIDGYSQPGATPNTLLRGDDANLLVEIDASGVPSGGFGLILMISDNNTIRGLVINRYLVDAGVGILGSTNTVQGNFIGTDPTGMVAAPSRAGVEVIGGGNTIGGADPASRNIIVGSSLNVVALQGAGSDVVQGNYIGTNREGTASLGSFFHGIALDSGGNLIGGFDLGEGNLVSGNGSMIGSGIIVASSGNTVAGNLIGTDRDGVLPVPNGGNGILVIENTANNVIFGNTVAFNGLAGVRIGQTKGSTTTGNRISQNSIWSNGTLGIELGEVGVLPNDAGDADTGANDLQNFPELSLATSNGVRTTVVGTLDSTPNTTFRVEFFATPACDPSGNGEGQTFLGATSVTTDGTGDSAFEAVLPASAPGVLTATVTNSADSTSEFAACIPIAFTVRAQSPALGPEFQVNTYTTGNQYSPSVGVDPESRFVIAWRSNGQIGAGNDVFGQRYDELGAPQGGEFQVNTYTTGNQFDPSIGVDAEGDFIVAWAGFGIFGRLYDAAGTPQGDEFAINTYTTGMQLYPDVARSGAGEFVVAWQAFDAYGMGRGIFGRLYDAAGSPQGGEIAVSTYIPAVAPPSGGMDAAGNFVVTWTTTDQDGSLHGVSGQRYDDAGVPQGEEFEVNAYTTGMQGGPSVGMDAAGSFVVAWASVGQDGSESGVFGRPFDAAGLPLDTDFPVNATTADDQLRPRLGMDAAGNFVVAWTSQIQDGFGYGVFGRAFDSSGRPGAEFQLNTYTTGGQARPEVEINDAGSFVVAWTDYSQDGSASGVFARRGESRAPQPMRVDVHGTGATSNLNGVLEAGETVVVGPAWQDTIAVPLTFTGTAFSLAGPSGPTYAIDDDLANYGTVAPGLTADCFGATTEHDCYVMSVSGARPENHWDATFEEAVTTGFSKTWTMHVGGSFSDTPTSNLFYSYVEGIFHNGVTSGCGGGDYCPGNPVRRDQMAVFLLKAKHGSSYAPPPCSGVFADVTCPSAFADWIEQLAAEGITAGCGGANYCPGDSVTRQQMAAFLLKAQHGASYAPPACAGIFGDVACPSLYADWVEQLYAEAVTGGCSSSPLLYCPASPNTRGQMAVFLVKTFGLLLYGP